jgi:Ser/Thr protein kinase RdoA (MazF antagonist)
VPADDLAGGTLWRLGAPGGDTWISLGAFLGRLDRALSAFSHPGAERTYAWDLARAGGHLEYAHLISGHERQRAVRQTLERFANDVAPRLSRCPIQVIHNDANDRNVLLDRDGRVSGLLDFGDMVRSHG